MIFDCVNALMVMTHDEIKLMDNTIDENDEITQFVNLERGVQDQE